MKAIKVASLQFFTVIEQEPPISLALCDKLTSPFLELKKSYFEEKAAVCFALLEYSKIHPHYYLELKSLSIVLRYSRTLQALSKNTRRDNRKLSQRKRRLLKKRNRLRSVH